MLFTDIEGSTLLLRQLGDRYGELLSEHRRLLRDSFAAHAGREIDTQGDAFFVAFARARSAVEAAVEAQRALAGHEWPDGVECRVRMGLHTGEPAVGEEGYHGMGLHRGARVAGIARGGQILLSSATAEVVHDDLPSGMSLRDLGERRLKDIDRPERVFQLVAEGLPSEFPLPGQAGSQRPRRRRGLVAAAGLAVLAAAVAAVAVDTLGRSGPATATAVSADSIGVFHPGNGKPVGEVSLGSSPSAVVSGYGSIWATSVNAHTLSRIDPVKQVVIDTIQVGSGPAGIAVGGGFVWVTNGLDGTVSEINPKTDTVVKFIQVGNGPEGIAADSRYVWVANSDDGTVTRIPLRGGKPLEPVQVGQSADGVAVGDGSVWVTSETTGTVTRVDARSGSVIEPIAVGTGADGVALGADAIWVANRLESTVTRIDPATNAIHSVIPVGDGASSIAVEEELAVWVSNELAGTLSRIDPARDVPVQTLTTGNRPEGVALTSDGLYVAVQASGLAHRGGTLNVLGRASSYPGGIDPAVAYTAGTWQWLILTNDGLTGFRRTGGPDGSQLVPDLATSLPAPTDNGTTYTFQLRPGIRYSNGALVRPQDFRRAIERALLHPDGPGNIFFSGIVGAETCIKTPKRCDLSRGIVTGAGNTVRFHLTSPDPDFLDKLALPEAFAEPADTPLKVDKPLPATGPYMFASYDPNRGIRLVRNPYFREWAPAAQPSGYPDQIDLRLGGTADAHVTAVEHGKADFTARCSRLRVRSRPLCLTDGIRQPTRAQPSVVHLLLLPEHAGGALRQPDGTASSQLRGRSRRARRTLGRPGFRADDMPVFAAELPGIPAVLPLHAPSEQRRCLDGPRPRKGPSAHHRIAHKRTAGHAH